MKFFSNINYLLLIAIIIYSEAKSIFDYSHIEGSGLSIIAGKLSSKRFIIPFSYNDLHICNSSKISSHEDTLGEILTGEKLFTTGYQIFINNNQYCNILCYNQFNSETIKYYHKLITRDYFINWYLDKLPAGKIIYDKDSQKTTIDYFKGIPLGYKEPDRGQYIGKYYIYNHLHFRVLLNKLDEKKFDIVGFNILPMSIKHDDTTSVCAKKEKDFMNNLNLPPQPLEENTNILFTYDVVFEFSNTTMASRWDHYKPSKKSIHWTAIILSNLIIIFLAVFIFIMLSRSLRRDIDEYNVKVTNQDVIEIDEYGWKQVAGDVFRPPMVNRTLLCSLAGTGINIFLMLNISMLIGAFGFNNPEKRAYLLNLAAIIYVITGLPSGYISTTLYKYFGGRNWFKNVLLNTFLLPSLVFFGYFGVNIILKIERSTASTSAFDIIGFYILWSIFTFPFILMGSFFAIKNKVLDVPCRINPIPSVIPEKPFYYSFKFLSGITGIICFATVFIELSYVMASLWRHQIYFMVTFLYFSYSIYAIICCELSIIVVYFNLCKGDYKWWWKSFFIGISPVIYFILYSIYYFFTLKITRISAMAVYFGIMGLISLMIGLAGGSLSMLVTLGFLKNIYSQIKND